MMVKVARLFMPVTTWKTIAGRRSRSETIDPAGDTGIRLLAEDLRKEELGAIFLRRAKDVVRGARLDNQSFVKEVHPISDTLGEAHLMGHYDHGHTVLRQLDHHVKDFLDHFRGGGCGR